MADRQENELAHDHPLDMDPFQKGNVRYEKWITFVRDAEQRLALVSQRGIAATKR